MIDFDKLASRHKASWNHAPKGLAELEIRQLDHEIEILREQIEQLEREQRKLAYYLK